MKGWFEIDKDGLARILRRRGIEFVLWELVSNAWDSGAGEVNITLDREPGSRDVTLRVADDDPDGFKDISHAYTMFADSSRRGDAEKRGRFNLGEKLVLAVARRATIATTKGTISFDEDGRHTHRTRRQCGSAVSVVLPMTREEQERVEDKVALLIPPILTTFNGHPITQPPVEGTFRASLETVVPDAEGVLRSTHRMTTVDVLAAGPEGAWLYEMGIPVVPVDGDTFSYNVKQKVPVSMERDNVPPGYLRTLRTRAFNELHTRLLPDDCNATWAREAVGDPRVEPEAVRTAIQRRFGDHVVAYDPSDREANSRAVSSGYVVVHGAQLSKAEWDNVRRAEAMKPAGQVTPSPKPYSAEGRAQNIMPPETWTASMRRATAFAQALARHTLGISIAVRWVAEDSSWPYIATFGPGGPLTLNRNRIPRADYDPEITRNFIALLIHEFGHQHSEDHLSAEYHRALCNIGAALWGVAHDMPLANEGGQS